LLYVDRNTSVEKEECEEGEEEVLAPKKEISVIVSCEESKEEVCDGLRLQKEEKEEKDGADRSGLSSSRDTKSTSRFDFLHFAKSATSGLKPCSSPEKLKRTRSCVCTVADRCPGACVSPVARLSSNKYLEGEDDIAQSGPIQRSTRHLEDGQPDIAQPGSILLDHRSIDQNSVIRHQSSSSNHLTTSVPHTAVDLAAVRGVSPIDSSSRSTNDIPLMKMAELCTTVTTPLPVFIHSSSSTSGAVTTKSPLTAGLYDVTAASTTMTHAAEMHLHLQAQAHFQRLQMLQ